ncbi:MAG: triose-phosphate isomerase [Elusimicrobia bacterium]|nr:triose-phosphate isomerase [Elusimicrobiota bacterium]
MSSNLRKPLIAGNWKMHLTLAESVALARTVKEGSANAPGEIAICVPFTALSVVAEVLKGSPVKLGAQDLHWESHGAYTGEISASQIKDAGAQMTLIAHSERRRLFNETDAAVNKKIKAALAAQLIPVLCIGETLEEREASRTFKVLQTQLEEGLKGFAPTDLAPLVIAYEPVWAIGTGKTATPDQAQEAHLFIRKTCSRLYGEAWASGLRILYGGSVTPENVDSLMSQPDVDGALVGGASLKPVGFLRIVHFQSPAGAKR